MHHKGKVGDRIRIVQDRPCGAQVEIGDEFTIHRFEDAGAAVFIDTRPGSTKDSFWFVPPDAYEVIEEPVLSWVSCLRRK